MTTTFETLGVSSDLTTALKERGITEPFEIQEMSIPDGLDGHDICGKAKTGSGKTLAFGLPILERVPYAEPHRPSGLILVPTRELANQVADELEPLAKAVKLTITAMYGGVSIEPQIDRLEKGVDVVVGTPGRLIDLIERRELSVADISMLVLDEADRMADMGFMPQVQKILRGIEAPHQTLLYSATLDRAVNQLVDRYMEDPIFHEVESAEVTVDAMEHLFLHVHQMDKVKVAAVISESSHRTLIFVRTKRGADRLVRQLQRDGIDAGAIHGDLRQAARERALKQFSSGKLPVLVATDVAARGIHIDDIDVVVHYDPAEDAKQYLHRSGRTARAGETGVAVTMALFDQENDVRFLQRRLGLKVPMIEIFSNDERIHNLHAWAAEERENAAGTDDSDDSDEAERQAG